MFPGTMPRSGAENGEFFKQLPEADRARVRAAFEKAWNSSEVNVARENLNKANEDYRKTLHKALQDADPDVVQILEKLKQQTGWPMSGRMPDPNEPDFGKRAVAHLAAELAAYAKRDGHEGAAMRTHDRVMQIPAVSEAVKRVIDATDPQQKTDAWKHLREVYFAALKEEGVTRKRDNASPAPPKPPGDAK